MEGWRKKIIILLIALSATALLLLFDFSGFQSAVTAILGWVDDLGAWGAGFYLLFYMAVVILLIPGVVFTLGAGFLFGFWIGGAIVITALAIGSGIAFLIARHTFGENLSRKITAHPKIRLLDQGMEKEGWKIVLLSRFLPGFPYKLSNYFFGLTAIPFRQFFLGNLIGVIPLSLINVYIGSLSAGLTELFERETEPWEWVVYGIALLAAICAFCLILRIARRSIRNTLDQH